MPRRKKATTDDGGVQADERPFAQLREMPRPDKFLEDQFAGARSKAQVYVEDIAEYARAKPQQAMLSALGAGYILRMLPTARLLRVVLRLAFALLKPALLIYGISKVYSASQQDRTSEIDEGS